MTTRKRIVAIGVVAALGVMAWSTLRNPDNAPAPPPASRIDVGQAGDTGSTPAGQSRAGAGVPAGSRASGPGAGSPQSAQPMPTDFPRYLRELDKDQVADKFGEMLDPGDCSQAIDPDGRIVKCNPVGVLNQRLQEQLRNPDPDWAPLAARELQAAVEAIERQSRGRIRTVDLRCGRDVCQILTIAPAPDHNPTGGWDDASRTFGRAQWWKDLGFADMGQSMSSGPDGHTIYYVTQLTAKPRHQR